MGHTKDIEGKGEAPCYFPHPLTSSHPLTHPHTHTVVFMGSKKYPGENTFDVFTKRHGGFGNASTDYEMVGNSTSQALRVKCIGSEGALSSLKTILDFVLLIFLQSCETNLKRIAWVQG